MHLYRSLLPQTYISDLHCRLTFTYIADLYCILLHLYHTLILHTVALILLQLYSCTDILYLQFRGMHSCACPTNLCYCTYTADLYRRHTITDTADVYVQTYIVALTLQTYTAYIQLLI